MKSTFLFIIKIFALWMIFFLLQRILFYVHYSSDFDVDFVTLLQLPLHSIILDLSSFAYLMGVPFILICISLLSLSNTWHTILIKITKYTIWFLAVISSILFSSELVSYFEWRAKLSSKIFIHFSTPSEIFRTSSGNSTCCIYR